MIQIVLLFLLVIALLGVGGKWLRPPRGKPPAVQSAARCAACRSYVVGRAPAPCSRDDCPYRPAA